MTVFVAVIAVLVLGVVAYLRMTPDLLPNMDFPYVVIMTTYPGASPEKVEAEITRPLEQSMSTLEHIVEVTSTSSENYSMVMLEFEESVNMDTIGVDIQQAITTLQAGWDDMVGAPYVLKINPSMLPISVAAVSKEGMDTVELTDFLNETLMNKLEGIAGVARITASGTVQQELHVILDQNKIDALNKEISDLINEQMDDAAVELDSKLNEVKDAQQQLEKAKEQLEKGNKELADKTAQGEAELNYQQSQLVSTKAQLQVKVMQLLRRLYMNVVILVEILNEGISYRSL
jgi:HAE1 family hydrophobic/amphiphilic exporter-1